MFKKMAPKNKNNARDLLDMEAFLQSNLKPVSPRPEFIRSLQKGLMDYTFPQTDPEDMDFLKTVLFAVFGFTGLVFVFSLWIRLLLVIISTLGMIQSSKRRRLAK